MKWRIKGIDANTSLSESAAIILTKRLKDLLKVIRAYFTNESAENLHQVRIALRRLRYNLEVFFCCLDNKIIRPFYSQIENLQDLTGTVRDIDVLKSNIVLHIQGKCENVDEIILSIDWNKTEIKKDLRLILMKFIHGKELKNFRNQLKKRR